MGVKVKKNKEGTYTIKGLGALEVSILRRLVGTGSVDSHGKLLSQFFWECNTIEELDSLWDSLEEVLSIESPLEEEVNDYISILYRGMVD